MTPQAADNSFASWYGVFRSKNMHKASKVFVFHDVYGHQVRVYQLYNFFGELLCKLSGRKSEETDS